ncbi:hypothetical protein LV779_33445 [Streptomyces thinghirensis]|nr:hypothetical protein [Streptomyces thinghirensis]
MLLLARRSRDRHGGVLRDADGLGRRPGDAARGHHPVVPRGRQSRAEEEREADDALIADLPPGLAAPRRRS